MERLILLYPQHPTEPSTSIPFRFKFPPHILFLSHNSNDLLANNMPQVEIVLTCRPCRDVPGSDTGRSIAYSDSQFFMASLDSSKEFRNNASN
jgi:hypothetical protein